MTFIINKIINFIYIIHKIFREIKFIVKSIYLALSRNMAASPKYFFISGLPRSGSTLLSAILLQNPVIHAGMHSALAPLWVNMIDRMDTKNEFQPQLSDTQRLSILKGIIENYYSNKQDKKFIFDTARAWQKWLHVLVKIWPDVKVICCVRDVGWIADSIERLHKDRPWAVGRFWENGVASSTVYDRINSLQRSGSMVGYSLAGINEALNSEQSDHMLLVDYDTLVKFPRDTIICIYQWLGMPYFEHDFNNVKFDGNESDGIYDNRELHSVRPVVEPNIRETILPAELFNKMSELTAMWKKVENTKAQSILQRELVKEEMPEKAKFTPETSGKSQEAKKKEEEDMIDLSQRVEEIFDGKVKVTGPPQKVSK